MQPTSARALGLSCLAIAGLCTSCDKASSGDAAREVAILSALIEADEVFIRSRPELTAGKYARMAAGEGYEFYRGAVPLYRADFRDPRMAVGRTRFPANGPLPLGLGDPHPENFGLLKGADGVLALEPNDLDSADRYPYHWDLRRLTVGLVLLAHFSNPGNASARQAAIDASSDIVRAAVESYADGIVGYVRDGAPRERVLRADVAGAPVLDDLFDRGLGDDADRSELLEQTRLVSGARTFRYGLLACDDLEEAIHPVPDWVRELVPPLLERYRRTLIAPPPPEFFTVLDVAQQVGSGVASWPRTRLLVAVRGPTDDPGDDEILEIKEELDSGADGWIPPGTFYNDVPSRIRETTRAAWAIPEAEPLWSAEHLEGIPVQIRRESEAHKTLRVVRVAGRNGGVPGILETARILGRILARVHSTPVPGAEGAGAAIADAVTRDREEMVLDEIAVALAYAERVRIDYQLFVSALERLGPTLGVPVDERDRPRGDLRAWFGVPATETEQSVCP